MRGESSILEAVLSCPLSKGCSQYPEAHKSGGGCHCSSPGLAGIFSDALPMVNDLSIPQLGAGSVEGQILGSNVRFLLTCEAILANLMSLVVVIYI